MIRVVPADREGIALAALELRAGRLVAFPTETVYGLGARARDAEAVASVFRVKGRPPEHPLIVHLPDGASLGAWADPVPEAAERLAAAFWPGPLTLVLHRAAGVPDVITGGQDTVALRVPSHPVAAALLRELGEGVAAPSANRFGRISPTRADHVAAEFADLDLVVLDGGPCEVGLESTILDLSGERPQLLRPGRITAEAIGERLGLAVVGAPDAASVAASDGRPGAPGSAAPRAPGRLASHYAPAAPTRLLDRAALDGPRGPDPDAGLLLCRAERPAGHRGPWRRLPATPDAYGRGLYEALRALDDAAPPEVVVERPPRGPGWTAVHDRLSRAAGPRPPAPRPPDARAAAPTGDDEEER
jgi:L-threonylcarbamoyladenylate synthase